MTDELTWLRELEQLAQKERNELREFTFEWSRVQTVCTAINARIITLLEAEPSKDYENV